ncbi:MAG: hypothetical protein JSS57_00555 [Proteobacteria bacterium]|nr:hypothetical protein [Pseudomonadota bacterium]
MKTSNPYGANYQVKVPPETINSEMSQAGGKAKARYPSGTPSNQPGGGGSTSGSFKRAYTPGTSPAGS